MGEPIAEVGYLAGVCGHDGTDWIKALIDAAGHLQVDVIDSGGADLKDLLDKLDDCLTALQKIDDLQNALDSVGTDELDVNVEASVLPTGAATETTVAAIQTAVENTPFPVTAEGGDVLFNFESIVAYSDTEDATDIVLTMESSSPSSGKLWVIQNIAGKNLDGDVATFITFLAYHDGSGYVLKQDYGSSAQNQWRSWQGTIVLDVDDVIRVTFSGVASGETCQMTVYGYQMDAP